MIDKELICRIAIGIFAVHLLVTNSIFLVGEFILGIDYMIGSSTLLVALYLFVFIKWISQLLIITSVVNIKILKYRNGIFSLAAIAAALCTVHLCYIFYTDSQTINDAVIVMKADSFKNISLFVVYIFSVNLIVRSNKEIEVI